MTIKVGDRLPAGTLQEFYEEPKDGCAVGPNPVKIDELTKGRKVVVFGLPGAFTPTCSAKHVPSYLANYDKLKAKGIDTIACMAVNDAFVMGAWGRDQKTAGKIRMMADGSGGAAVCAVGVPGSRVCVMSFSLVRRGCGWLGYVSCVLGMVASVPVARSSSRAGTGFESPKSWSSS